MVNLLVFHLHIIKMECRKNKENLNTFSEKKTKVYNVHNISIEKKGMDICLKNKVW